MLRLIGAGFGRTGTTSLKAALEELGFGDCYHMQEVIKNPSHVTFWREAWANWKIGAKTDWQRIFDANGYQATVDWPACTFYQELMESYPNAKVLLSVRNPEKWYESTFNTIYGLYRRPRTRFLINLIPPMRRFVRMNEEMIWQGTFAGNFDDRQDAIRVFTRHNDEIKSHVPPQRLLVYDVKEGWEPLCNFLGVPVPNKPFPHLNDTKTFQRLFIVPDLLLGIVGFLVLIATWIALKKFK